MKIRLALSRAKSRALLAALAAACALACGGCKNMGYNPQSAENALTPRGGERTYTRDWQTDPKTGETVPVVREEAARR